MHFLQLGWLLCRHQFNLLLGENFIGDLLGILSVGELTWVKLSHLLGDLNVTELSYWYAFIKAGDNIDYYH